MKLLAALLTALMLTPSLAQPGQGRGYGPGPARGQAYGAPRGPAYGPVYGQSSPHYTAQRPMPPPERRMGWEERQRLREQVRNGQMTRDEARQLWREQRAADPRFSPKHRDQLRRDVQDANRDLKR